MMLGKNIHFVFFLHIHFSTDCRVVLHRRSDHCDECTPFPNHLAIYRHPTSHHPMSALSWSICTGVWPAAKEVARLYSSVLLIKESLRGELPVLPVRLWQV